MRFSDRSTNIVAAMMGTDITPLTMALRTREKRNCDPAWK
jgi:hypothetical protein